MEYPIGHPIRRQEGIPKLIEKYKTNLARVFSEKQQKQLLEVTLDYDTFIDLDVSELMDLLAR
ncbi:2-methylcitrate dehydratase [compost metagenome]